MLTTDLKKLSRSEKLLLINDLWDDVSTDLEDLDLTHAQERKLDDRYEQFQKNPDEGITWREFRSKLNPNS